MEKGIATHSSILAWDIPRTEEQLNSSSSRMNEQRKAEQSKLEGRECVLWC